MTWTAPDITDRTVAVLGGGTQGRRIALMWASQGGKAVLHVGSSKPMTPEQFESRSKEIREFIDEHLDAAVEAIMGKKGVVEITADFAAAVKDAWLVVESTPENLELKIKLFGDLDQQAPPDAILATNSSSYRSDEMIDNVRNRERVCNLHFFMPPELNNVEIMTCGCTDPKVMDFLAQEATKVGLKPFIAKEPSTGLIINRIWAAVKRETLSVIAEGIATPSDIDTLYSTTFGAHPPCRLMDKVGLDVVLAIEENYASKRPGIPEAPRVLLRKMIAEGKLGVKSGEGFYKYT